MKRFPLAFFVLLFAAAAARAQAPVRTLVPLEPRAARFGEAVAVIPDTDGDGLAEFAVGAPNEDVGGVGAQGRVYVFSGATGALRYRIEPPDSTLNYQFGSALAGVPDADGDGYGDLLVGVPDAKAPGGSDRSSAGRAHLFSGATGALLQTLDTPVPDNNNDFGIAVAGLKDVDGDGRGDLAIGSPNEFFRRGNFSVTGRVYVFSGATGLLLRTLEVPSLVVSNTGVAFGKAVATVSDVDGDGADDLAVGAPGFSFGTGAAQRSNGRAYLISGATGALIATFDTPAGEFEGVFGTSVAGVPDADGDGRSDVLVGAPGEDENGLSSAGRAYLFSGATGALLHRVVSPAPRSGGGFGRSAAGLGDLNGDGRGDLAVGAPSENRNVTSDPGRVHVFSGASGKLVSTLRAPDPGNPIPVASFGWSVAGAPDLDADGRAEVLVGAVEQRVAGAQTGSAFLYRPHGDVETAAAPRPAPPPAALSATPNPVRGVATFSIALAAPGFARLTLHDALGRTVAAVSDGMYAAGVHTHAWDTSRLSPGLYLARLTTAENTTSFSFAVVR